MKIGRKGEEYGSFEVEFSEKFEEQLCKAARQMSMSATKHPVQAEAEAEKLIAKYRDAIESLVSLLLGIIGLAFYMPAILNYVFNTLKACFVPLADHLGRETRDSEVQNAPNN